MTDNVLELLQARSGPLFWVSALAMAAGGTALVIAPLLALRRWRRHAAGPARQPARPVPAAKAAAQAAGLRAYRAQAGGAVAAAAGSPVAGGAPAGGAADVAPPLAAAPASGVEPGAVGLGAVRLAPLLARLRRAAAELEDYAARDEAAPPAEEKGLKALAEAVEYVHKAGR